MFRRNFENKSSVFIVFYIVCFCFLRSNPYRGGLGVRARGLQLAAAAWPRAHPLTDFESPCSPSSRRGPTRADATPSDNGLKSACSRVTVFLHCTGRASGRRATRAAELSSSRCGMRVSRCRPGIRGAAEEKKACRRSTRKHVGRRKARIRPAHRGVIGTPWQRCATDQQQHRWPCPHAPPRPPRPRATSRVQDKEGAWADRRDQSENCATEFF